MDGLDFPRVGVLPSGQLDAITDVGDIRVGSSNISVDQAGIITDAQSGNLLGTLSIVQPTDVNALNRAARDYPDIAVDREIGPRTLSALDGFLKARGKGGETVLLRAMEALQGERYIALAERRPSQEAFLYGWLANRIG